MVFALRIWVVAVFILLDIIPLVAQTTRDSIGSDSKKGPYFYEGLKYGSQGNFNPASVLMNRGFEMMRITKSDLVYDPFHYRYRFDNVFENLSHPFKYVQSYGTKDFFLEQVIPFGNPDKPYWYPNYTLHLIGGGITYTGLKEWFVSKKVKGAGIWSGMVVVGAGLINEAIEEREFTGDFRLNVDVIADVWLFDLGGILLFQSEKVNYFFSKKLHMRDWSRQPMFLIPGTYMGNCGQFFSFKLNLPKSESWHIFSMMGLGGMIGVSHTFKNNYGLSLGFGQGPRRKEKQLFGLPIDVSLVPMAGLYLDRNNSLLASLEMSNSDNDKYHNYFAELNIYPGIIKLGKHISPATWMALSKDKNLIIGLSCNYTFGFGLGFHTY
jgi:hypothetical protein